MTARGGPVQVLPHENMPVYRNALLLVERAETIARSLPPERPDLRDQLRRAVDSIVFNIAEGAGEYAAGEKARFYRIARRSATEVSSILDVIRVAVPRPPEVAPLKGITLALVGELDKLVFVQQRRR
jgi:four helix bundle protein